jgi:hypothetical protein
MEAVAEIEDELRLATSQDQIIELKDKLASKQRDCTILNDAYIAAVKSARTNRLIGDRKMIHLHETLQNIEIQVFKRTLDCLIATIELLMVAAQVNRDVRHPWSA